MRRFLMGCALLGLGAGCATTHAVTEKSEKSDAVICLLVGPASGDRRNNPIDPLYATGPALEQVMNSGDGFLINRDGFVYRCDPRT
jgi:hypothetical protein